MELESFMAAVNSRVSSNYRDGAGDLDATMNDCGSSASCELSEFHMVIRASRAQERVEWVHNMLIEHGMYGNQAQEIDFLAPALNEHDGVDAVFQKKTQGRSGLANKRWRNKGFKW